MREIRFRGKRVDNGEWVYGGIFVVEGDARIVVPDEDGGFQTYRVDPKTVGQWIGLQDKNSKDVYEDDIVRYSNYWTSVFTKPVIYKWGSFGVEGKIPGSLIVFANLPDEDIEVVSNIHDNPELLEGSHAD